MCKISPRPAQSNDQTGECLRRESDLRENALQLIGRHLLEVLPDGDDDDSGQIQGSRADESARRLLGEETGGTMPRARKEKKSPRRASRVGIEVVFVLGEDEEVEHGFVVRPCQFLEDQKGLRKPPDQKFALRRPVEQGRNRMSERAKDRDPGFAPKELPASEIRLKRKARAFGGLKVQMIRGRSAASRTVVEEKELRGQIPRQIQEDLHLPLQSLGPMLPMDDRHMPFEDRIGIAQDDVLSVGEPFLLRGKRLRTEETRTLPEGFGLDGGACARQTQRIVLQKEKAGPKTYFSCAHMPERLQAVRQGRPLMSLPVKERIQTGLPGESVTGGIHAQRFIAEQALIPRSRYMPRA